MGRPKRDASTNTSKRKSPPGKTVEARENQLISLAISVAEKQLLDGTASAQVITHFLKLGSTMERLERDKLVQENKLLQARTESLQSQKNMGELYQQAIIAIGIYSGKTDPGDTSDDIED